MEQGKCVRRKEQQGQHMMDWPQPCTALWGAGREVWSEIKPGKKGEVGDSFDDLILFLIILLQFHR